MGEAAAKEPTMEDILSSIRKIIAEEDGVEAAPGLEPTTAKPVELGPSASMQPEAAPEPVTEPVTEPVEVPTVEPADPVKSSSADASDAGIGALAQLASEIQSSMDSSPETPESVAEQPVAAETAAIADEPATVIPEPAVEPETSQIVSRSLADIAAAAKVADVAAQAPAAPVEEAVADTPMPVANPVEPAEIHVEMAEAEPAPVAAAMPVVEAPAAPAAPAASEVSDASFKGALMSPSADAATSGAFDRLKRSVMDDLEAQTEAVLRPMLREWLDENLPNLVERLVREEIERVARG